MKLYFCVKLCKIQHK